MSKTKKINQRWHFRQRAQERFGLTLTREDVRQISIMIRDKHASAVFVRQGSTMRCSIWDLVVRDIPMRVVYDKKRHTVVTAYPPDDPRAIDLGPASLEVVRIAELDQAACAELRASSPA